MPRERPLRDDYVRFVPMTTRLKDNDQYLHMNNTVYYEYFDTVVNLWLIRDCGLTLPNGPYIGIIAETQCSYLSEVKWPQNVVVGMRIDKIGSSSITYGMALFGEDEDRANAICRYVHVYCDGASRRPKPLPEFMLAEARKLLRPDLAVAAQ